MIRARAKDPRDISKLYSRLSRIYDLFTDHEPRHHRKALELGTIGPGDAVLEVAVGTGRALPEIATRVGERGTVCGLDLTGAMLRVAEAKLKKRGLDQRAGLVQGSAFSLPYQDGKFDAVYNAYMLDLIDSPQIPGVLLEFKRVLKPGGEIILVNMSKNTEKKTLFEFLYERGLVTYGNCRPVLAEPLVKQAGFENARRVYRRNFSWFPLNLLAGTEIVIADKPS